MESRQRTSPEQFSLILEFMESHGDLSRPQPGLQGRVNSEQLWQELTEILNSVGAGVNKTADKWKRVWSDWKTKTKKKASIINQDIRGTGGGPSRGKPISRLEERILRLVGITAVTGNEDIQEAGFPELDQPQVAIAERVPSPVEHVELLVIPPAPEDTPMSVPDIRTTTPPAGPVTSMPGPSNINRTTQEERSPVSGLSTPRRCRRRIRQRRLRQTPFDRATSDFVAVEEKRLRLERERHVRLFQIESERLKLEADRIRIEESRIRLEADLRESNQQLHLKITALIDLVTRFTNSNTFGNQDTRPN